MNLIQEIESLTPEQRERVQAYIAALKGEVPFSLPKLTPEQERNRDEIMKALEPYRFDMSGFKFNREEANARKIFP